MKIGIPVWKGRVSPVFDTARHLMVVDVEAGKVLSQHEESLMDQVAHLRRSRLVNLGVEVMICGAISRPLAELITGSGIRLIPFLSGDVEDVIQAFLAGNLPSSAFLMPGCCGRRRRPRSGRGRGAQRGKGGIR